MKHLLKGAIFALVIGALIVPLNFIDSPVISDSAAFAWLTGKIMVSNNDTVNSESPKVATDSFGRKHIVWDEYDGSDNNVYYERLDPNGNVLINNLKINNSDAAEPSVAVDSNGDAFVIFSECWGGIKYRKVKYDGSLGSSIKNVWNDDANQYDPSVVIDSSDNMHIVWKDQWGALDIAYKKIRCSDGSTLVGKTQVNITADNCSLNPPGIDVDASGNAYVVWMQKPSAGSSVYYVKLRNISAAGPERIIYNNCELGENVAIAVDATGNSNIVWNDDRTGINNIYYEKVSPAGAVLVNDRRVSSMSHAYEPQIVLDPYNNAHVVWRSQQNLYYEKINYDHSQTEPLVDDMGLIEDCGSVNSSSIAIDTNDEIYLVWQELYDSGSCYEVFRKNFENSFYSISGNVTGYSGTVTLTIDSGGYSNVATIEAPGSYSFDGLINGDYLIVPEEINGYDVDPTNRSVAVNNADRSGQNFDYSVNTYTISGTVTGYTGGNVTITLSGSSSDSQVVNGNGGFYSFSGLAAGDMYSIVPESKVAEGWEVEPGNHFIPSLDSDEPSRNFLYTELPGSNPVVIECSPSRIDFVVPEGYNPADYPEILEIWESGGGELNWACTDDFPGYGKLLWATPNNGDGPYPQNLTIEIKYDNMSPDYYEGEIIIWDRIGDYVEKRIPATITVTPASLPTVTSVAPSSGFNNAATGVTIYGTNFTGATAVMIGAYNVSSFTVNSSTQISATIQAGIPAGTYHMTVTTPSGTSSTSSADEFTVLSPLPPPIVTAVNPNMGYNIAATNINIYGSNFSGATEVKIGTYNVSSFTVIEPTRISATIQAGIPAGTYHMTVTTPSGTSSTSSNDEFAVLSPYPPPTVTSVIPNSGYNNAATGVNIYGTNFTAATAVKIGTYDVSSFTVNSSTQISATIQAGLPVGTYHMTVTASGGSSATSPADEFTVMAPSDTIPPANITNLTADNPTVNSIRLQWTVPGDDGMIGVAAEYDIRYSTIPITAANWNTRTQVAGEPFPIPAGNTEVHTVTGLNPNTTYFFAMKTADEVPNWSGLSNNASATTLANEPVISTTQSNLSFTAEEGYSWAETAENLTVFNSGGGTLTWRLESNITGLGDVLSFIPAVGGTGATAHSVYLVEGIAAGSYSGSITISDTHNTPPVADKIVPVTITINPAQTTSISGYVSLQGGADPSGILVSCSGGSDYTDMSGYYEITDLADGSYDITATMAGWDIQPSNFANPVVISGADQTGKNLYGTPVVTTHNIAGTVTLLGQADHSGVTVSDGTRFTVTNASGSYLITGVPDGSYDLTATRAGWTIFASNFTNPVAVSGSNLSGIDFEGVIEGAPYIIRIDPTSGPVNSSVSIIGGNFGAAKGSSTLLFADMPVADNLITHWSDNLVIFTVPTTSTGNKNVQVIVGGTGSNIKQFNVNSTNPNHGRPSITSLSPISGEVATAVTLYGENFGAVENTVVFDGAAITPANVTYWSDTMIIFIVPNPVPSGTLGLKDIYVEAGGQQSNTVQFDVTSLSPNNNRPKIYSISPAEGETNITVTLTGNNFGFAPSELYFAGQQISHDTWGNTQITFTVPSGADIGPNEIYVKRAVYLSNTVIYTVTAPGTAPYIDWLSPVEGPVGISVTIVGGNFGDARDTLFFGGSQVDPDLITFWEENQIIFTVPHRMTTGPKDVIVQVGIEQSDPEEFNLTSLSVNDQIPNIESIDPFEGPNGISVTLFGNHFGDTPGQLWLAGAQRNEQITQWTDTMIVFTVDASATGPLNIFVVRGIYQSNTVQFNVTSLSSDPDIPSITSIQPPSGIAGRSVTLIGENFTAQGRLFFDGAELLDEVTHRSDNMIIFTVPIDAYEGDHDIYVIANGNYSNTVRYTVVDETITSPIPNITSINPVEGPRGISVTLSGNNFGDSGILYFDGANETVQVTQWGPEQIIFTVPLPDSGTTGLKEIYVEVNTEASNTVVFDVTSLTPNPNIPSIMTINPEEGPVSTVVTLEGANFGLEASGNLFFDGSIIAADLWTDAMIVFTVPDTDMGEKAVSVEASGEFSNTVTFTVTGFEPDSVEGVFNYPNPFDPVIGEATVFEFTVEDTPREVGAYVYDLAGRMVWKEERVIAANPGQIIWDGRDLKGDIVANGVYLTIVIDKDEEVMIGRCKPFVVKSGEE